MVYLGYLNGLDCAAWDGRKLQLGLSTWYFCNLTVQSISVITLALVVSAEETTTLPTSLYTDKTNIPTSIR